MFPPSRARKGHLDELVNGCGMERGSLLHESVVDPAEKVPKQLSNSTVVNYPGTYICEQAHRPWWLPLWCISLLSVRL